MSDRRHIVIIGGGFAGLSLMKRLDRTKFDITLVDRNNYHSFPPLFYQVASSGLEPASISFPFRREMRNIKSPGTTFHLGEVHTIDVASKCIHTQYETIRYDYLIIAAGTTNNYFNIPGLQERVFTIKSTSEAIRCRNEILSRLERAAITDDAGIRRRLLSFVVVGGGPSGVEVAGAIGEMKRYILKREYPRISTDDVSITLVESGDKLLKSMSGKSSREALEYLGDLMVDVKLNKPMAGYDGHSVKFTDGETIYSEMVIWTAGIVAQSFRFIGSDIETGPGKRYAVDEYNRIINISGVYAIGDICYQESDGYRHGHPQVAQVAIQQAHTMAKNFNSGKWDIPFRYTDKGTMATIGRNRAVADIKHIHLHGFLAWIIWMAVHLMSLLGMRNKIMVITNWIWAYFSYSSSIRLLFEPTEYPLRIRKSTSIPRHGDM